MITTVVLLLLLSLVIAAIGVWFSRRSRLQDDRQKSEHQASSAPPELTFETIDPGDAVVFWDETSVLAETVLECQENLTNRTTHWRWILLSDGKLVESGPMGRTLYSSATVFYQGTAPFAELTADADRGGVLKTFEERVREGNVSHQPVTFIYDGNRHRMKSTGTFAATVKGNSLPPGPWSDITANEQDNVYFKMAGGDGEEALGIWTTHIAFLVGRRLTDADLKGLYGQ
ncbi:MAG: hypothetical protein HYY30_08765 [Chloroflexi bacterium]|nr:hypothetical protein [Chloroflexota bacterium]